MYEEKAENFLYEEPYFFEANIEFCFKTDSQIV